MRGHRCTYVCADDTHGTPVMIRARTEGITPEALIETMSAEHLRDFTTFGVEFDNYYSTHSDENRELASSIYTTLNEGGHIAVREVEQAYCEKDGMWLPDRFLKGTCPKCGAEDQYGDSCDECGAAYRPTDLIDPRCSLCGTPPVRRKSDHHFFQLADFTDYLKAWVGEGHVHPAIANKLGEWFAEGLRDWDISRDGPYFGFPIPGTEDKYFYVWLDAPIGYMASFKNLCDRTEGLEFDDYWKSEATELYHFIGKDIVYFHALFWPAMLKGSGYRTPNELAIHGFLTVDGKKMSKSRGTFIQARTFARHLPPQTLRYYYASKLGPGPDDLDLSLEDFVNRTNAELVGKLANLLSRSARMVTSKLDGRTGEIDPGAAEMLATLKGAGDEVAEFYEKRQFNQAVRRICSLADEANRYLEETQPWQTVKTDAEKARRQLSAAVEAARLLMVYLKPIVPEFVAKAETCLAVAPLVWASLDETPPPRQLGPFERLAERIDMAAVEALIAETQQEQAEHK
jgi:methionyl-tRNA synthetase